MMIKKTERIDFMSDWQNNVSVGLGDVFLTEKGDNDEIISEIWMSTNQFEHIINFYNETFKELNSEDLIYKYYYRDYVDGDAEWAVDDYVSIERVEEFLSHLDNIDEKFYNLQIVKKEYEALKHLIRRLIKRGNKFYFKADCY